jgi:hypothetical protein
MFTRRRLKKESKEDFSTHFSSFMPIPWSLIQFKVVFPFVDTQHVTTILQLLMNQKVLSRLCFFQKKVLNPDWIDCQLEYSSNFSSVCEAKDKEEVFKNKKFVTLIFLFGSF